MRNGTQHSALRVAAHKVSFCSVVNKCPSLNSCIPAPHVTSTQFCAYKKTFICSKAQPSIVFTLYSKKTHNSSDPHIQLKRNTVTSITYYKA